MNHFLICTPEQSLKGKTPALPAKGLKSRLTEEKRIPCRFLDTYNSRYLSRDQLLFRTGRKTRLLNLGEGTSVILSEPPETGSWRILPRMETRCLSSLYGIRNSSGKEICRVFQYLFDGTDRENAVLMILEPRRGCEKESEILYESLSGSLTPVRPALPLPDRPPAPPTADPRDRAFDVLNSYIYTELRRADFLAPGIIQDADPECLHQYRVSLRRIRALVSMNKSVYSPAVKPIRKSLGKIMKKTGPLRDLDVLLGRKESFLNQLEPEDIPGVEAYFRELRRQRLRERNSVRLFLSGPACREGFQSLLYDFGDPPDDLKGKIPGMPALEQNKRRLKKTIAKTEKALEEINECISDNGLHTLRLRCKKLRYLCEYRKALFQDDAADRLTRKMKQVQTSLGEFNDRSVQEEFLIRSRVQAGQPGDPQRIRTLDQLIRITREEKDRFRLESLAHLKDLQSPEIRDLIAALTNLKEEPWKQNGNSC